MRTETLLTSVWQLEGNRLAAEIILAQLESGELQPAGNFRNESPDFWQEDEE
jgi:hypothetical protein